MSLAQNTPHPAPHPLRTRPQTGRIARRAAAIIFLLLVPQTGPAEKAEKDPASASPLGVRFLEPDAPVLAGLEQILVEVDVPEGDRVDRLDLFVDGVLVHRAHRPPFRFEHDFGPAGRPHVLLALVFTRNGLSARAEFRSRPAPLVSRVDVQLVQIVATVLDSAGRFVTDLGPDDFRVSENGVEQEVAFFERGGTPGAVALTLDCSGSMKHRLWGVQKAASDFLKALPEGYQVSVLGFNDEVFLAQDFTAAPRPLLYAIHQLRADGETALFDAVRAASLHLRGRPERRAVVLFTDGQESIYGRDAEGEAKLREALDAANLAEVTFFAIGYGGGLAADLLERIAADTGGKFFPAGPKLDLGRVYAEIASTLGSQYTLAYYPDPPPPPGEWRSLEVRVSREGAAVRARRGYWAARR